MIPAPGPDLEDQQRRTLLSWRRTALSLVAAGTLVGHLAVDRAGRGIVSVCLALLAVVIAFCWLDPHRRAAAAGAALVVGAVVLGILALAAVVGA